MAIDLLGDLGGAIEMFFLITALFLEPFTEYSFTMKAIQKLYYARTKQENSIFYSN